MNKVPAVFFLLSIILIASCKDKVQSTVTIYTNDFEKANLSNITNGVTEEFNNSAVLGQYNNGGFTLRLDNLPKHDLVTVAFDLYIHDTWDGNKTAPDGPDIWQMLVDGKSYINTTFSNMTCTPGYFCSPQSYPANYPNNYNNPKAGAYSTNLPGVCGAVAPNGTTQYKITKTFTHTSNTLLLQCLDKLVQNRTASSECDGSWSVDNISVKAITL